MNSALHQEDVYREAEWGLEALCKGIKKLEWIPDTDYSRTTIELYKAWPMDLPILKKFERGLR